MFRGSISVSPAAFPGLQPAPNEASKRKESHFSTGAERRILEKTAPFKIHSFIADNSQEKLSFPAK